MFGKKAHFTVLDLTIPLDWNQEYYDDGYTEDLIGYALGLRLPSNADPRTIEAWIENYEGHLKRAFGVTQVVEKPWLWLFTKKEVHNAYHRFNDDITQTFVRGRQETVALRAFHQMKKLEKAVKNRYGFLFFGIESKRVPGIGGIYGLLHHYTPKEIVRHGDGRIKEHLRFFLSRQDHKGIEYEPFQERMITGSYKQGF